MNSDWPDCLKSLFLPRKHNPDGNLIQGFKDSKIQKFKDSKIQRFKDLRKYSVGFRVSAL